MRRHVVPIFGLIALAALVSPRALSQGDQETQVKVARETFESGKHAEAVALALPLAEKGNPEAFYLLGFAHETGQGAEASTEKAIAYYKKAIAKGSANAGYRLAFILLESGEKEKIAEAKRLLEAQAESDPAVSGRILGEAWLLGRFSEKPDSTSAIKWWEKASEAGDVPSQMFLARFYGGQMGFPELKNPGLSLKYFLQAAEAGNAGAMVGAGSRLLYGEGVTRDEEKGKALLNKAIEAKDFSAYLALGKFQEVVKKDFKAALEQYQRGADEGQVDCMIQAATYYLEGRGVDKDVTRATKILNAAAEKGNPQAHLSLAILAFQEEEPDVLTGYKHLLSASTGGLATAQNELGLLYLSGKLGVADVPAAITWFGSAAQANYAPAQNNLGALYEQGTGVPQNYETAAQYYNLSAAQGNASAVLALARFHAAGAAMEVNKELAWALAKLAEEYGEGNAAPFVESLEKLFSKEQLATAKKELARLKKDGSAK